MPFDFAFHSVQSSKEIRRTVDFLAKQDLGYPNYDNWVQRTESELFSGYKRAGLAYSNGILVGDVVWQPHKQFPRVREMKNLRISPQARGRYLGQFLLRQVEVEDKSEFDALIGDARETQEDLIRMMQDMDYRVLGKIHLYDEGRRDVILFKAFDRNLRKGLVMRAKSALRL